MGDDLGKVDVLRDRLQASYEECLEALEASDGDVLGALASIERTRRERGNSLTAVVTQAVTRAQEVGQDGVLNSLGVRLGDHLVAEIPVALTGAAAASVAVLAVLLNQLSLDARVYRQPGPTEEEGSPDTPTSS